MKKNQFTLIYNNLTIKTTTTKKRNGSKLLRKNILNIR